jgi:aminoglycoside phosphotransferase (APT) family kinase protein
VTDRRGRAVVIRRPPEGELLPKAHDMHREHTVLSALGPAGMPVPEVFGLCGDHAVTGATFYVMGLVEGRALYNADDARSWLDAPARAAVGSGYIATLARLHQIDPVEVGLGELGRPDGYVARQLRAWYRSWEASIEAADYDDPRLHELHETLMRSIPEQGPARVVHGDYGLHNTMISPAGEVTAVLDWEIATLGDPLADLAYAVNGWAEPGDEVALSPEAPTLVPGFVPRRELIDQYGALTGADLSDLDIYRAFNYFKVACIIHGVYARYRLGMKSTEGVDLEVMRKRIGWAIDLAVGRLS